MEVNYERQNVLFKGLVMGHSLSFDIQGVDLMRGWCLSVCSLSIFNTVRYKPEDTEGSCVVITLGVKCRMTCKAPHE